MKELEFVDRYRIEKGEGFRLKEYDPEDTHDLKKDDAKDLLAQGVKRLSELQEKLYASDRWSLLAVFQAMDAAGKDSAIEHTMTGVNPQGCQVHSFKAPTSEELDHDFLWRIAKALPERGRIGIFNRSHYEEVLVVRVHPEFLKTQRLPPKLVGKDIWQQRFEDITGFERHLARNGTAVCKFFLHVSKEEQKKRFLERIDDPAKNWKFSMTDVAERARWDEYMAAYEDAIRHTSAPHAPWYVLPADHKWFTRLCVVGALIATLEKLDLAFPVLEEAAKAQLGKARQTLSAE
ncbi:MAG: Polyphosphate kinase 2 [Alphaproteobacteria bacterium]|nr:Polyphosphate kinase 2 [Alphaproteobacteria bacterium]